MNYAIDDQGTILFQDEDFEEVRTWLLFNCTGQGCFRIVDSTYFLNPSERLT